LTFYKKNSGKQDKKTYKHFYLDKRETVPRTINNRLLS